MSQDKKRAFKEIFSNKSLFVQLMRNFSPPYFHWTEMLTPDRLELINSTFIDPELVKKESDVLYKLTIGNEEILIYVLLEHQSTVDYLMIFRLLSYMVRIWEMYVCQHRFKIPKNSVLKYPDPAVKIGHLLALSNIAFSPFR